MGAEAKGLTELMEVWEGKHQLSAVTWACWAVPGEVPVPVGRPCLQLKAHPRCRLEVLLLGRGWFGDPEGVQAAGTQAASFGAQITESF